MLLQQNDGVFPNATNATGTLSVVAPSGTSVIAVNVPRQLEQMEPIEPPIPTKMVPIEPPHHTHFTRMVPIEPPIPTDEILPGFIKKKRQHNTCHLTCTRSALEDICKGSPVFASCNADCALRVATPSGPGDSIVGPLGGINTDPTADVFEDQITCLTYCNCAAGHGEQVIDDGSDESNPFQGLD